LYHFFICLLQSYFIYLFYFKQEDENDENTSSAISKITGKVTSGPEVAIVPKEKSFEQLSKKERKELRLRELNALNSLLEEFIPPPPADSSGDTLVVSQEADSNSRELSTAQSVTDAEKQKKKKKKKSTKEIVEATPTPLSEGVATVAEGVAEVSIETDILAAPANISEVLKNRVKAKKSTKPKTEAQRVAEAEALKAIAKGGDKKDKKKKDKKNYNEMSHYN